MSYDKNSGKPLERLSYKPNSKKAEKWTFIQFDNDGEYPLDADSYLTVNFCWFSNLESFAEQSKENPINWNDYYSAVVRKCTFTKNNTGFNLLEELKQKNYLCYSSVTLCKRGSLFFYCFDIDENNEIDISSCYEIKLIK